MPLHEIAERVGNSRPAAIFDLQGHLARYFTIYNGCAKVIEGGWIDKTSAAFSAFTFIIIKWKTAAGAAWFTQKSQRLPAREAKKMRPVGYNSTTRTAWWKREIRNFLRSAHYFFYRNVHPALVPERIDRHKPCLVNSDTPFDRGLRRLRRDRAARNFSDASYLYQHAADELLERLTWVKRDFQDALILGSADGYMAKALKANGLRVTTTDHGGIFGQLSDVQCDEDRLPFADKAFDLIISVGTLDSVNDLPGALILARRALKPDGLFLAAFAGADSLPRLRSAMLAADLAKGDTVSPHIHPQIDIKAAGDLLSRAGFALPVVDSEIIPVRFPNLLALVADLRAMGATNIMVSRSHIPISRMGLAAAIADFAAAADPDGKTTEHFNIVYMTGWSPAPGQPKPAKRGSARRSLATTLRPPPPR
jgi:SAM-dependent methyltransferase